MLVIAVSASSFVTPDQYSVSVKLELTYINLTESIVAYYDGSDGLGRVEYWGGQDVYVSKADGESFQVVPVSEDGTSSVQRCFTTGKSSPTTMFPDLTAFAEDNSTSFVDGVEVVAYRLWQPELDEKSGMIGNYTFYVSTTGTPVRYSFVGHNTITGGHYDSWTFEYSNYTIGAPSSKFFETNMTCEELYTDDDDDGGPTEQDFDFHPEHKARRLAAFESFRKRFAKEYKDDYDERFALFVRNSRMVTATNRRRLSYTLAQNFMSDWTDGEKARLRGRLRTPRGFTNNARRWHEAQKEPLPETVDWRNAGVVTAVKDQGSCGSCWSFGTTGAIEGQLGLDAKKKDEFVELSQQNLMDCSWVEGNAACDGGLDSQAYDWMLNYNQGGIATTESYGQYENADGRCHQATVGARISGYVNVSAGDLNDALYNVGPISVSINASPDSFYYYKSGYYDDQSCSSSMEDLDHTVLAVGYVEIDGDKYTIIKNSWSTYCKYSVILLLLVHTFVNHRGYGRLRLHFSERQRMRRCHGSYLSHFETR